MMLINFIFRGVDLFEFHEYLLGIFVWKKIKKAKTLEVQHSFLFLFDSFIFTNKMTIQQVGPLNRLGIIFTFSIFPLFVAHCAFAGAAPRFLCGGALPALPLFAHAFVRPPALRLGAFSCPIP